MPLPLPPEIHMTRVMLQSSIPTMKANEMHYSSNLFLVNNSTSFGQIYCPTSEVSTLYTQQYVFVMLVMLTASKVRMELTQLPDSRHNQRDKYLLLCIQYQTPDDGQQTCPKHVEFFIKNKFGKKCILLAFIIGIYHDAQSSECQILQSSTLLNHM